MTIQIPNPGTGNGATGDNEFVLWSKVKANFEDQTNAASRLVGEFDGTVPINTVFGVSNSGWGAAGIGYAEQTTNGLRSKLGNKSKIFRNNVSIGATTSYSPSVYIRTGDTHAILSTGFNKQGVKVEVWNDLGTADSLYTLLHNYNTTTDANGFIKAASPIVKLFADKIECNDDAESQNINFIKNGIGDYTLQGTNGLSNDGWYIELPKDLNGNPKVAVTLTETDGVISLKCYKRIFSMTTFTFEPDLDEPLDVPDGRWIDLRLNEITTTDSVPLDEPIVPDSEV